MPAKLNLILLILCCFFSAYATAAVINVMDNTESIQDAINAAQPGDTVLVHPDTYTVHLVVHDKDITLASLMLTTNDPAYIASTILDGNATGAVIDINNLTADALITGFTIQNAVRGIYQANNGVVNLSHLVIKDHSNGGMGGGVHLVHGDLILSDAEIYNNVARDGAGICLDNTTSAIIERVNLMHNTAQYGGGIRILSDCTLNATTVLISDNTASRMGGGINVYSGSTTLNLANVTFHGNVDQLNNGGGIRTRLQNEVNLVNCIFDDNQPKNIYMHDGNSELNISYTDVIGGQATITDNGSLNWGNGNIDEDPLFEDPDNDDFHLTSNSLCIDAGDPNSPDDPDGTTADMGRYYYFQYEPPVIEVTYPTGTENLKNDDTETITWTIADGGEIVETVLSYSIDGGNTWIEIATVAGDVFEYDWTVPELYSVHCLVKVSCIDEFDNTATDESDAVFSIETTRYYHWFDPGWTMMSLPLKPYHASPQNVLGDDIDGVWDCFGFGYHTGHYRPDHMFTEQGYWLVLAHEGARVDVRGRANLETVVIKLDLPWNMIGSPFPVEVKLWKDVEFRLDGVTYSVYQACEAGLIVPTMWACKPDHKYYIETTTFRPWQGAWFFCLAQDLEMLISPPSPDPAPAPQRDENEASQDSWELTIGAELVDNSHDIAALGSHYEATDAFDLRFDFPKPPAMMESSSITAYFLHEDALDALPDRFNRDMRAVMDDEQYEWTLYVDAEAAGEVTLSWSEILNSTPEGYEFTLIDTDARRSIDMLEADDYTYETEGGISEFTVRVIATPYGVEGDASPQAPSEFNLMSAYPNPFNATTTISYDLPYSSDVVVGIYDLSGRNVTTLVSDYQETGSYTAVWNAEGMAAGIYLIRLSTTEHVVISKVALVK